MKVFSPKFKLILLFFIFAVLTWGLAILFSGPEDTWIRNQKGEWVKHGNPSTPRPSFDWKPPIVFTIAPILIFTCFFVPFLLKKILRPSITTNDKQRTLQLNFLWYLKTYILVYIVGVIICFLLVLAWGS
ncbi:MAG: hypothetical protein A2145_01605 [candidate division Zixibacteria bacterium RBG_16_40_9]|nr:MAG: hypothetical protein A2145_01605 [candidate division Zixibacteria bacterium RBG_16_40_9]